MSLLRKLKAPVSSLRRRLRVLGGYLYDIRRFTAHSQAWHGRRDEMHLKGQLLRKLHSLEKGLSMPAPRRVFGEQKIAEVEVLVAQLKPNADNRWILDYAHEVVGEVRHFNESGPDARNSYPTTSEAVLKAVTSFDKAKVLESLPTSPERFFATRRSVRIYKQESVPENLLRRAAALAQQAPSVCNRQSGRVRFYSEPSIKKEILALQDGNKGFGHQIPTVAVISSDLRSFHGGHERNQGYVDGGLFAMSLTFALHCLGLGSCMMNWCVGQETDRRLRTLLDLPDNEIVITLMSVGFLPDAYHVARSRRRPPSEVILALR